MEPQEPQSIRALVTDIVTRWNSLLACVCSVIENHEALDRIWQQAGDCLPLFNEDEWQSLEALAQYLIHFDKLTLRMQGDMLLASDALLVVQEFQGLLHTEDGDHRLVKELKVAIQATLSSHRSKLSRIMSYLKTNSLAAYCACIDPRYCSLASVFPLKNDRKEVRANFFQYAVGCITRYRQRQSTSQQSAANFASSYDAQVDSGVKRAKNASHLHYESSSESELEEITAENLLRRNVEDEYAAFVTNSTEFDAFYATLNGQTTHKTTKAVFSWWKQNAARFPHLRIVAAALFSVRVTSASVERLFSLCGLIRTARRNRLGPGLFDALIAFGMNDSTLQELRRATLEKRLGPDQLNNTQ